MHTSTSGNALLLTLIRWPSELPIPSSALPASGSLGIISARNIKAPLVLTLISTLQSYTQKIYNCKSLLLSSFFLYPYLQSSTAETMNM